MEKQMKQIDEKITNALNINNRLHGILNVLATAIVDCRAELDNKHLSKCFVLFEQLSEIVKDTLEEARDIITKSLHGKEPDNGSNEKSNL